MRSIMRQSHGHLGSLSNIIVSERDLPWFFHASNGVAAIAAMANDA